MSLGMISIRESTKTVRSGVAYSNHEPQGWWTNMRAPTGTSASTAWVTPGGAWLSRSFGRHQGRRTRTATSIAAMTPTAGAFGSRPGCSGAIAGAGNSSARITGVTIAHQTIARCADIASMKKTPSHSSVVHRVAVPRRARTATTASAEPIMNRPETSVAVTGAHSLIVLRMIGLVDRSYAYRQTSTPNGFSSVAA